MGYIRHHVLNRAAGHRARWPAMAAAFLCAFAATTVKASEIPAVLIDRRPPVVRTRTFDPRHPPADMPPLSGDEAAVTQDSHSCQSSVSARVSKEQTDRGCRTTATIESVTMTLQLTITIWLPVGAAPKLERHETAHRQIHEHYYEEAEAVARSLGEALIGRQFTAEASDCERASQDALNTASSGLCDGYTRRVPERDARAQVLFDQITDSGRNNIPEPEAIRQAIEAEARERTGNDAPRDTSAH